MCGGDDCPGAKNLCHGPSLGDAATRRKWRVAIEDLANTSKSVNVQVVRQRLEKLGCPRGIIVHAEVRQREGSEQPAPNGALVICAVSFDHRAAVAAAISWIIRREAAKAVRGQEMPGAGIHHSALLNRCKGALGQRHCEDLIRADRSIMPLGPIEDIEATLPCFVPETRESRTRALRKTLLPRRRTLQ